MNVFVEMSKQCLLQIFSNISVHTDDSPHLANGSPVPREGLFKAREKDHTCVYISNSKNLFFFSKFLLDSSGAK